MMYLVHSEVRMLSVLAESEPPWTHSLLEHLFVGPMLPASMLAVIVFALVLISLLGAFALDLGAEAPHIGSGLDVDSGLDVNPHLDAGIDPGLDGGALPDVEGGSEFSTEGHSDTGDFFGGFAAATIKAVHLDRVPLMVWLAVFSLLYWVLSYVLWFEYDVRRYQPTFFTSTLLTFRNGIMAVVLTRLLTGPLHRLLVPPTHYHESTLVGGTAIVETSSVDAAFGRARYATNAAPLLINIRTLGSPISKGTAVRITRYDESTKVYYVEAEVATAMDS